MLEADAAKATAAENTQDSQLRQKRIEYPVVKSRSLGKLLEAAQISKSLT